MWGAVLKRDRAGRAMSHDLGLWMDRKSTAACTRSMHPADRESGVTPRALHVAALPFPTHQGTQAALRAMMEALARAGRTSALLAYASAGYDDVLDFLLHRAAEPLPYRSLRSGPSAHKLLADAALARALRALRCRTRPELIVAHHVEAAAIACAPGLPARRRRSAAPACLFFAHTDLEAELPAYAHPAFARWLAHAGASLDGLLLRRAHAVAAISPALSRRMRARADDRAARIQCVLPPWPVPPTMEAHERAAARASFGIGHEPVLLYAGNLDRYQGWEDVVHALAALPDTVLLVGTCSDRAPLLHEARRAGVAGRVRFGAIDSEPARRRLHACADLGVVPRRAEGGLPIKLLDALARGLPCAIAPRARAGLTLDGAAHVAGADDAHALASAVRELLASPARRQQLAHCSRRYVALHHSDAAFLTAYDRVCAAALAEARARFGNS